MKNPVRCVYLKECYLAESMECYGFKTDCPLYLRSNDEPCNKARFHAAMDRLIARTKTKHDLLNKRRIGDVDSANKAETNTMSS